jgi:hypothetical protein
LENKSEDPPLQLRFYDFIQAHRCSGPRDELTFLSVVLNYMSKNNLKEAIWDVENELHHWMPCKDQGELVIKGPAKSGLNQSQWGITSSNSSTQERQLHTPKVHVNPLIFLALLRQVSTYLLHVQKHQQRHMFHNDSPIIRLTFVIPNH